MNLGKVGYQLLLHHPEDHSAQDRTPNRSNAANHRHQQDVNTGLEGKHTLGINESGITCEHATGHAGKGGCYSVDSELVGKRVNAEVGGGVLVLLDGF